MDRLEALKILCTVVESGGFSKAAEKLGISTSSVTNQMVALERHFQVKLLNRTTRSMSLTEEGQHCYEQALPMIREMTDLEERLQNTTPTPSGTLRVDTPGLLARLYVAQALPRFLAEYPAISLKITVGDRLIDMVDEGVDVLIRIGKLQDSTLIAKTIAKTEYVTCASPDFIRAHGVPASPDDLFRFACLSCFYPQSQQVRKWMFQHDGESLARTPSAQLSMDHVDSLIEAGIAGGGIIQHLSVSLREPLRTGKLVPILQSWQARGPDVSVIFQPKLYRSAKVKAFVAFVEQIFRE